MDHPYDTARTAGRRTADAQPTRDQIHRWQRYLSDEIVEGQIYREIAHRRQGPGRDILPIQAIAERARITSKVSSRLCGSAVRRPPTYTALSTVAMPHRSSHVDVPSLIVTAAPQP